MLKPYVHHAIALSEKMHGELLLDEDFIQKMDMLTHLADTYGFTFFVNSGFRKFDQVVHGAIVEPAKMGNHFVGCAIDANIIYEGKMLHSDEMQVHPKVIKFGTELKSKGVRWGGFFQKVDSIHFDNGMNLFHPEIYRIKFREYQNMELPK